MDQISVARSAWKYPPTGSRPNLMLYLRGSASDADIKIILI